MIGGGGSGVLILFFGIGYGLSRCGDGSAGKVWLGLGLFTIIFPTVGLFIFGGIVISYILGFFLTIWNVPLVVPEEVKSSSHTPSFEEKLMPEQLAVRNYIISSRQKGMEENEIIVHLQEAGWRDDYITQALRRK